MKKLIALLLAASMFICMTACKDKKPNGMSQELYDISVKALEIMDKYNNMDIDVDDAYDRIQVIYDKIDNMNLSDKLNEDETFTDFDRAFYIKSDISLYKHALFCIKCGEKNNTSSDIYSIADELRKDLELD